MSSLDQGTTESDTTQMEIGRLLDSLNDVDMFCLRYVYLPRINSCSQE